MCVHAHCSWNRLYLHQDADKDLIYRRTIEWKVVVAKELVDEGRNGPHINDISVIIASCYYDNSWGWRLTLLHDFTYL